MNTKLDLETLDAKIKITDYIALFALILTLFGTTFSLFFRDKQNKLLKAQREQDQVNIAQSGELSEYAKKDAALALENAAKSNERANNAELKSKQLEIELLKLKLAVSNRFIPANVFGILSSELKKFQNKKALILCAISNNKEPEELSNKFHDLFKSANWKSEIINQRNVIIPAPTGIKFIATGESNKMIAELFYKQFSDLGYECVFIYEKSNQADLIIQVNAH